jgi:hypothetical protein
VQARTGSTFTIAGVMAVALVLPSPADAQTVSKAPVGFTYLLVRDFDAVDTSQEMLCNYAFNDGGQLAYTSRRIDPTNSHIVTSLFYWSGGAEQLVYREDNPNDGTVSPFIGIGCPSAHGIGLNNNGLIALPALGPTGFARLFFRPGPGLVDTVQTLHSNDNSRGKVNAGGQVAYWDNGASGGYVIGSEGTAAVETFAPVSIYPMDVNLGGGPTINDAGRVAMIGTDGISTFLVEHNPNVGTQIGPSSDWAALYAAPGLNKLGFTAFMTDGPQGDHPSSTFRVVMLSPDLLTAKMLADNTVFTRDAFEYSPPSLNDWNQVLIGVNDTDGTSLWILDATRQLLVFMQNQPFSANGQTISDGGLSFLYRDATINNSGDVAFDVTYTNASPSARHGIFIAHPDAGLTPANPVMDSFRLGGGSRQDLIGASQIPTSRPSIRLALRMCLRLRSQIAAAEPYSTTIPQSQRGTRMRSIPGVPTLAQSSCRRPFQTVTRPSSWKSTGRRIRLLRASCSTSRTLLPPEYSHSVLPE